MVRKNAKSKVADRIMVRRGAKQKTKTKKQNKFVKDFEQLDRIFNG